MLCGMAPGPPRDADPIADWIEVMSLFGLPGPRSRPSAVSGGWSHSVWRVDTDAGVYAIKEMAEGRGASWMEQLATAVAFEVAAWRRGAIAMAEPISLAGSDGFFGRMEAGSRHRWYRCHRWIAGEPCLGADPDLGRSAQVGGIVAELSLLELKNGSTADQLAWNALDAYEDTVTEAHTRGFTWAGALAEIQPHVERLRRDLVDLARREVPMWMSHRDIDPKNTVTRPDGVVALLDWDNAGPRLLESELLDAAISFAGEGVDIDGRCVAATMDAYRDAGGRPLTFEAAATPIAADGFSWMMFNAWRALGHRDVSPEQETFAGAMVEQLAATWPAETDAVRSWAAHAHSG
jgi:hypothetical protein